jgi:hypothetical protein
MVDCGMQHDYVLLIAGTMLSLDSFLQGFLHSYFDTITTVCLIEFSRSRHLPGDHFPGIPPGYHVHANEVIKP